MNDKNFMNVFFGELKSKWFIVIILAVVVGGALALEKNYAAKNNELVAGSTEAYAQKIVRIVYDDPKQAEKDVRYQPFFDSTAEKYAFMKEIENRFDYTKFHKNLEGKSSEKTVYWLIEHLTVSNLHPDMFMISFSFERC